MTATDWAVLCYCVGLVADILGVVAIVKAGLHGTASSHRTGCLCRAWYAKDDVCRDGAMNDDYPGDHGRRARAWRLVYELEAA
jgi:hypothetical protein